MEPALGFAIDSDPITQLAFWIGAISVIIIIGLFFQIIIMRLLLILRLRHKQRIINRWRPLLIQSLESTPEHLPGLTKKDTHIVLQLWNNLYESIRGESQDMLIQIAQKIELPGAAQHMLGQRKLGPRFQAILLLGNTKNHDAWDELAKLTGDKSQFLSLSATEALVRIDAGRAISFLMPLVVARHDWPSDRVAGLLREAGPGIVSEPLAKAIENAGDKDRPRMIRYLELAHSQTALPALNQIIISHPDDESLAACLHILGGFPNPKSLQVVRQHLQHSSWFVRVQAVTALGKIGVEEDLRSILSLLNDQQRWVRYRAAQALVSSPASKLVDLKVIQRNMKDPFARDILGQVIAEQEIQT
jgi:hypothetical protein